MGLELLALKVTLAQFPGALITQSPTPVRLEQLLLGTQPLRTTSRFQLTQMEKVDQCRHTHLIVDEIVADGDEIRI